MNDIVKYSATIQREFQFTAVLASKLPPVIAKELNAVVARDVHATRSIVTFHGGQSRAASPRIRFATKLNLVSPFSRGAIQVEENGMHVNLHYSLGFPKWVFWMLGILLLLIILVMGISLFYTTGEPILNVVGATLGITALFSAVFGISFGLSILRFHLFLRKCLRKAEQEVENVFI